MARCIIAFLLAAAALLLPTPSLQARSFSSASAVRAPAVDPLAVTLRFLSQLYNNNSLEAIDAFCDASFTYQVRIWALLFPRPPPGQQHPLIRHHPSHQGCGVWLPDALFRGPAWLKSINAELFAAYSGWQIDFLEAAATPAAKNAAPAAALAFVFFHWRARNTGL
jgi:hypothetical protein